ncbi:MAG: hypothetical protein QOG94_294 [Solirubrobacteraceae bacterium]|nr:hypothetical protein [Solirubrobacteraceae bacterium]
MTASPTHRAIEAVWRIESARLIAGLARMVRDVGLVEDLAQDALVAALEKWPGSGVPENAAGAAHAARARGPRPRLADGDPGLARRRSGDGLRPRARPRARQRARRRGGARTTTTCCRACAATCWRSSAAATRRARSSSAADADAQSTRARVAAQARRGAARVSAASAYRGAAHPRAFERRAHNNVLVKGYYPVQYPSKGILCLRNQVHRRRSRSGARCVR